MILSEEKEIFNAIAQSIVSSELDDKWDYALLKMMVIADTVELNLHFYYNENAKNTKLNGAFKCSLEVLKLYKLTHEHPNYKKWNRSTFRLYANSKMQIDYIWDEELQKEVDEYNKENQS